PPAEEAPLVLEVRTDAHLAVRDLMRRNRARLPLGDVLGIAQVQPDLAGGATPPPRRRPRPVATNPRPPATRGRSRDRSGTARPRGRVSRSRRRARSGPLRRRTLGSRACGSATVSLAPAH